MSTAHTLPLIPCRYRPYPYLQLLSLPLIRRFFDFLCFMLCCAVFWGALSCPVDPFLSCELASSFAPGSSSFFSGRLLTSGPFRPIAAQSSLTDCYQYARVLPFPNPPHGFLDIAIDHIFPGIVLWLPCRALKFSFACFHGLFSNSVWAKMPGKRPPGL